MPRESLREEISGRHIQLHRLRKSIPGHLLKRKIKKMPGIVYENIKPRLSTQGLIKKRIDHPLIGHAKIGGDCRDRHAMRAAALGDFLHAVIGIFSMDDE